jgi:hypothetical protein
MVSTCFPIHDASSLWKRRWCGRLMSVVVGKPMLENRTT